MLKFFTDSIEGNLVKSLLYNTPLYTLSTVSKEDYIIVDSQYIYGSSIILCKSSGYLDSVIHENVADYVKLDDLQSAASKITSKHYSPYTYYDSYTHKELGHYLRQYRDLKGINLMPFYNCFCNQYVTNLRIREGTVQSLPSDMYKLVIVPIKLNKEYTVALDCSSDVLAAPVFLNGNSLIQIDTEGDTLNLTKSICVSSAVKTYNFMSYSKPVVFSLDLSQYSQQTLRYFKQYENYLYLLMQIPATNNSSITVLEGNYLDAAVQKIFSVDHIDNILTPIQNNVMLSKLSLLMFNCKQQVPCSERLIEYLLENVITPYDKNWKDIYRMQESLHRPDIYECYKGVWSSILRKKLFDLAVKSRWTNKYDLTGFVDKDIELMQQKGDM